MNITESSPRTARRMRQALLVSLALAFTGCGWSSKSKGTAVGTTAGAAAGAVVGKQAGSTARGAIIGAVVGGAAGAIIGNRMDQQARELEIAIPGATVERVGEGLIITFASGLMYDFDSDAIRTEAGRNLQSLATSLNKYSATQLLIVGHRDARGAPAYNQDLSTRRANSASRYLATRGVAVSRIHTSGKGEMEPVATNDTEFGRQTNRRIEVAIYTVAPDGTHSR